MKTYLVGGAIRDKLLNIPVVEYDWVVVGSTPEEMIELGYKPVGKDFPVFLHPETKEEYALARTEKKIARGYKGFTFYTSPNIKLEEDLKRRDLTINAIAQDSNKTLIDPYNGQADIKNKILRHVSNAFCEDPVRVLRIARFASKLPCFKVHNSTNELMCKIVSSNELSALTAERVWKEFEKSLAMSSPWRFIEVLDKCGAWQVLFPEIDPSPKEILPFKRYCLATQDSVQRFAFLCRNLSSNHAKKIGKQYKIPKIYSDLAEITINNKDTYTSLNINSADDILDLIKSTDALRKQKRFNDFISICQHSDAKSCSDKKNIILEQSLNSLGTLSTTDIQQLGISGLEFANAVKTKQLECLKKIITEI